ncbi:peptidase [Kitasatospora sp. NBC_01287]|uniref:peptidase n=1 Tax=Kitasatospora sp. NBC_01287 TaxID=2903573 RepID=UPI0022534988|nr:peptidase [Kitasatospora sp. NBC_01287]MCX4751568.1 peptidase [Kitasatospora sp. NBC_01287]
MRAPLKAGLLALGLGLGLTVLATPAAPVAAAAAPSPSSSVPGSPAPAGSTAPATTSGTSFLTATTLAPGQDAAVTASTGDYLYWAFAASAGQTATAQVTVTLPAATDRHGPQTWSLEVFDGLRRRQACTAGPQNASADQSTGSVTASCTLRQIRGWAEPWSGDPLPGTYYLRLSVSDVPQQDLGLAAQVAVHVSATGGADDAQPEGGDLKAPLVPPVNPGSTTAPGSAAAPTTAPAPSASTAPTAGTLRAAAPVKAVSHWYSELFSGWNTRWFWTMGGGVLAALAGVAGYRFTRHPRRRRLFGAPPPPRRPEPAAHHEPQRF